MSAASIKLSPTLKALIAAPHALGSAIPAPSKAASTALFDRIRSGGKGVGDETWLCLSTAALVTVNSPDAVCELFSYAAGQAKDVKGQVRAASVSVTPRTGSWNAV
jgi:hypothetical protein